MLALVGLVLTLFASGCADEGNVFSLEVGDCFGAITDTQFSDVSIVECSEPHEHEVFAVWNVAGDTLPSQQDMTQGCIGERFEDAIGIPYDDSELFAAAITPSAEGFDNGDREVICYSAEFDESNELLQVAGSVLGSNR
ncbi:MAG: septum formation family protein [Acidimicrobiales bacterium]